jgi:hypothetical protein
LNADILSAGDDNIDTDVDEEEDDDDDDRMILDETRSTYLHDVDIFLKTIIRLLSFRDRKSSKVSINFAD